MQAAQSWLEVKGTSCGEFEALTQRAELALVSCLALDSEHQALEQLDRLLAACRDEGEALELIGQPEVKRCLQIFCDRGLTAEANAVMTLILAGRRLDLLGLAERGLAPYPGRPRSSPVGPPTLAEVAEAVKMAEDESDAGRSKPAWRIAWRRANHAQRWLASRDCRILWLDEIEERSRDANAVPR